LLYRAQSAGPVVQPTEELKPFLIQALDPDAEPIDAATAQALSELQGEAARVALYRDLDVVLEAQRRSEGIEHLGQLFARPQ
jgi:hypothetical protein